MNLIALLLTTSTFLASCYVVAMIIMRDYPVALISAVVCLVLLIGALWAWPVTRDQEDRKEYHINSLQLEVLKQGQEEVRQGRDKITELEQRQASILGEMENRRNFFPGKLFLHGEPRDLLGIE